MVLVVGSCATGARRGGRAARRAPSWPRRLASRPRCLHPPPPPGFAPEANTSADLLASVTDTAADMALFFEAFPAQGGAARTT